MCLNESGSLIWKVDLTSVKASQLVIFLKDLRIIDIVTDSKIYFIESTSSSIYVLDPNLNAINNITGSLDDPKRIIFSPISR